MVFRLPTTLEPFIPPPSQQSPQQNPWRGALVVSGMRPSDRSSAQTIRVTAVETDGENRTELWPSQFFAHITHGRPILRDMQAWVKRHTPPLCTFMPDRHRDPNINTVNQTLFRSLSRILFESQTVGISSWGSDAIPGAGVIIFPASNSSSLLVGALFLTSPFPDFVLGSPIPLSPGAMPGYAAPYQSLSPPYASSSRHHQTSSPPEQSYSINHANTGNGQDQYRYMVPRTYSTSSSSSSGDQWPSIKDEDRETYANRYARIS